MDEISSEKSRLPMQVLSYRVRQSPIKVEPLVEVPEQPRDRKGAKNNEVSQSEDCRGRTTGVC